MADWLTVTPNSGSNNYNLVVKADENDTITGRTTYIKAYNTQYNITDYCRVHQTERVEETIIVSPTTYEVNNFHTPQDNIVFEIISNGDWSAITSTSDIVFSTETGSGDGTVSVSIVPDKTITGGTRTIIFKTRDNSVTVTLTQKYQSFFKYQTSDGQQVNLTSNEVKYGDFWYAYSSNSTTGKHQNLTKLTYLELDGITQIDAYGFSGCTNITTLIFNDGLQIIGNCAFQGVKHITNELYFPHSITGITSGKWFDGTEIDYAIFDCSLIGQTQWTSWSTAGWEATGTTSVVGTDVTIHTIELRSGVTLSQYCLALNPSKVIIRSGVSSTVPQYLYQYHYYRKYYNGPTFDNYPDAFAETGQIILDSGMSTTEYSSFLPSENWTITNA